MNEQLIPTTKHALISNELSQSGRIKVGHINTRSLYCHIDEVKLLINKYNFDFLGISESWLNSNISNAAVSIPGYGILRRDRLFGWGGVALYYKINLTVSLVDSFSCGKVEFLLTELLSGSTKLGIVVCYNPSPVRADDIMQLQLGFEKISIKFNHFIICGDFNYRMNSPNKFSEYLLSSSLYSIPFKPTRGINILDQIIIDKMNKNRILKTFQKECPCISDHDLICIDYLFKIPKAKLEYTLIPNYKNIDFSLITLRYDELNWNMLNCIANSNDKVLLFNHYITTLYNACVPLKKVINRNSTVPWLNMTIINAIKVREQCFAKYKRALTPASLSCYHSARNKVTSLIRKAKISYYFGAPQMTMKRLWKSLNEIGIGGKNSDAVCTFSPNDINLHFTTIPKISVSLPMPDKNFFLTYENSRTLFQFNVVDDDDVYKAIYKISSNAVGDDELRLPFIKIILPQVIAPIKIIINDCITRSVFPSSWKTALVTPLAKTKNVISCNDLRPISITPVISKVFELILNNQIQKFINLNRFINMHQSGFREHHSTATALVNVIDDLAQSLDKKNRFAVLVLLDFSKAFDCLDHVLLIQKLMLWYQFSPTALKLIFSFLSDRKQRVKLNGSLSNYRAVQSGVPQGSILGPLLFSLYLNDLVNNIQFSKFHLYADDCQIYISGETHQINSVFENLNKDLTSIHNWSSKNGICLNIPKCKALILSKHTISNPPTVYINHNPIPYSESVNNLGLTINGSLSWNNHVSNLCGKINSILYGLKLHKRICSKELRIYLVKSLVLPHINYCEVIYSNCDAGTKHTLQVSFNNAIRYVHNLNRYDHVSSFAMSVLGHSRSLTHHLIFRMVLFIYKLIKYREPKYLFDKIEFASSMRTGHIIIPRNFSNIYGNSVIVRCIYYWNQIPKSIRDINSLTKFKKQSLDFINSSFD